MKPLNIAILLLFASVVTAKRGWRKKTRGLRCKYTKGDWSECDTATNTVTRTLTLRNGENGCEQKRNQTISCVKYERIQAWKAKKMERKNEMSKEKQELRERHKMLKQQRKQCNYDYGIWSECDNTTYTVQRVLTLKFDQDGCEPTQTITIPCRRLNKIQNRKAMKMGRKQNRKQQRVQQRQERKEKRREGKEQKLNCRYDKGNWSDCDNTTNTVTRDLTLLIGEEGCEPTMDVTISCTKYERIQEWKARKMEMKTGRENGKSVRKILRKTRKDMKEKRKLGCSFVVAFSECDPTTNMVTKTYTPETQDDETCEEKSITYTCDMHNRLMEKKTRRQEKRKGRRQQYRNRFQNIRF